MDPATGEECPRARFDGDGRLLNADEAIGELVNKGGLAAFEGYYRNDEANAERSRGGWYWSGDLGYRDDKGFFYFAGRGYDWLRVDGENFSAAPVERIVLRHPDVMLAAVYAVPDPEHRRSADARRAARRGRDVRPGRVPTVPRRAERSRHEVGAAVRARGSPALPASHTNKIKKAQLRQEAWLVDDPIWFRPDRSDEFRPFEAADAEALERAFAAAGRGAIAPARP